MEINIFDIFTIIVAVLTIIVNVFLSVYLTRKNKYFDITVKQRLDNMHYSTNCAEKIMYITSKDYIASMDRKELKCSFVETIDKLIYELKYN